MKQVKYNILVILALVIAEVSVLVNYSLVNKPIIPIIMVLLSIAIMIFASKEREDGIILKNKLLFIVVELTRMLFLIGCHIEYYFDGMRKWVYIIVALSVTMTLLIDLIIYIKLKETGKFKYIMLVLFCGLFMAAAFTIEASWVMYMPFALFATFLLYFDIKLLIIASTLVNIFNLVGHYRYLNESVNIGNSVYNKYSNFIQTLYILTYTIVTCIAVYINKNDNNEKMNKINTMKSKSDEMTKEVLDIANSVKASAINTNTLIEELENETNNSLQMLLEISNGNSLNTECVEKQNKMSRNITDMIDRVLEDTDMVSSTTKKSLESLNRSKQSFDTLKDKSKNIVLSNEKVINTINLFVENARRVKNITQGISEISEQTNLLSLNASIESARAGELGKGFAVVANEIRTLADATNKLTTDIDEIVLTLEKNAIEAQNVVKNVVNDIEDENKTIDETVYDLNDMEEKINGLEYVVQNILDRVKKLSDFNFEIVKNVEKISDSSKDVVLCTTQALEINESNKKKADKTKELMEELVNTVNKMDVYSS